MSNISFSPDQLEDAIEMMIAEPDLAPPPKVDLKIGESPGNRGRTAIASAHPSSRICLES